MFFSLTDHPSASVSGSDTRFPIRRIFCVGRNYAAHAREMGSDERAPPFFFTKFPDAIVPDGSELPYPPATRDFQYEGELVIAIGHRSQALSLENALDIVFGYATGLDMTRRDLQLEARETGRPWDMGKNFPRSAPLGMIHKADDVGHLTAGSITLALNGEIRQSADLSDLIWNCAETIVHLSRYGRLEPGDLIYTGTPAGVGPVQPGDEIEVQIAGLTPLRVTIGDPEQ